MVKIKHTEVFRVQNSMLLNFSPSEAHSLLNNVKTQINKHKHMYNLCIQEAGVILEVTSILMISMQFQIERCGHESTYKVNKHS
jgi:hypothetical protein